MALGGHDFSAPGEEGLVDEVATGVGDRVTNGSGNDVRI
jgi:hypothetical protein